METEQLYIDEYGFPNKWSQETTRKFIEYSRTTREANLKEWQQYIFSIGGIQKINIKDPLFKQHVRKGIPDCYRKFLWLKITGVDELMQQRQGFYQKMLSMSDTIPENVIRVIDADVPRTFPNVNTFSRESLRNVLLAFAIAHPEIGYCQSLNFIVALLLRIVGEESALWMLCVIIEKYLPTDYYCNQMKSFQADLKMIEIIIRERTPDIAKLVDRLGHNWILIVSGWLLTFYSNTFPVPTVLRIWDSFFLEGMKIIYRVGISFLRMNQEKILTATTRKEFIELINQLQCEAIECDKMMGMAFSIKAFSRNHILEMRELARKQMSGDAEEEGKTLTQSLMSLFGYMNL
ncbi:TBC domain containing protein [Histomonas meleagridis]|uniref:TBC domain containing protein n=1 Tax=Histomonas meleagridis TaxID=135588 RepID=UPI00355AC374|nr:TBC domain containing protein [Histomonas meleagridis]KAH0801961.1 TBC domain containing protein [Histomonas meleagridis]